MLKGNVCIELQDVNTGETEKIEHHNLVTKGAEEMLRYCARIGFGDFVPLSTKMYGGLVLFDSALTASVTNTLLPKTQHIVGMVDNTANASSKYRGSYNTLESGKTSRGYKHIWDFSTSQCNGTIGALSLVPLNFARAVNTGTAYRLIVTNGSRNRCIYYDETTDYIYSYSYDSMSRTWTFYKLPFITDKIGLNFTTDIPVAGEWETVGSLTTPEAPYNVSNPQYAYRTATIWFASTITDTAISIMFIDIVNLTSSAVTVQKSGIQLPSGFAFMSNNQDTICVSNEYLYIATLNSTTQEVGIVIWNLNTSQYTHYILSDVVLGSYRNLRPYGDGTIGFYSSNAVVVYPDGHCGVISEVPGVGASLDIPYAISDTLLSGSSNQGVVSIYIKHRLTTIFNLSSPITKTASQTMKITYTLTEDEEE